MELRSEDSPGLRRWLDSNHYLSPQIVNEMITLIGNILFRKLLIRIREACWYSIIADETRNISNIEQLTVTIQWVSGTYEVQEDLIGMIHVQAYDGAANMMGHLRGVATVTEN